MYKFYLDSMELPLAPSKLTIKIGGENKTVNLINLGEINILRLPKLTDITFEFLVISQNIYDVNEMNIVNILGRLEDLKVRRKPFRFIVTRDGDVGFDYDTNLLVSLEEYTVTEDANLGSDILISVSLKQYKEYGFKTIKLTESPQRNAGNTSKTSTKKAVIKNVKARPSKAPAKRVKVEQNKMSVIETKKATGFSKPIFLNENSKVGAPMLTKFAKNKLKKALEGKTANLNTNNLLQLNPNTNVAVQNLGKVGGK